MAIEPVTNSHREISVVEPVNPALEHVKRMLFRPFDLGKWFVIGFCAWLAGLGESGGSGGNFGSGFNDHDHYGQPHESFQQFYGRAHDWTVQNLYWLVPVAIAVMILILALWVAILWLNSRGKFMFLHCVALNKAEISEPWSKFVQEANSLFWFRLVIGLAGMVLTLPLLVIVAVLIIQMCLRGQADMAGVLASIGLALVFFLIAIVFAIVQKFTTDFVVPIMFLRGGKCVAAWKEFYGLLSARIGLFTLYILFQIVLGMTIGVIVLGAILITCCIAGCLMIIPYLGTVLLLPVLVFKRAYPLYFIAQFGTQYDVFPPPPPTLPASGLQPVPNTPTTT